MRLRLRGATLIDGTGADPVRAGVDLDGERVAAVGGENTDRDGEALDLDGLTLLPGLIDAHTHLGAAYDLAHHAHAGTVPVAEIAARIFRNCELALDAGFTTCRELGGVDGGMVRAIDLGLVRGPRIFPSGPALAQDGGHGTFMAPWSDCYCPVAVPGLTEVVTVCNGADEVRRAARTAFRRGATQLKVFVSGGVVSLTDELGHTQLTVEELRAAVEEAEARDTYVTVHAHNVRAIRNGLAAGVTCFEHGSWLDEETANAVAAAGAALVPTLTVAHLMRTEHRAWGLPDLVLPRLEQVANRTAEAIKLARDAGVTIGSGSDLLGPDQTRRGLELALRAKVDGPAAAIVSATATNARILGQGGRLGTVEPGKVADLIAVRGDPLSEPDLFGDPGRVVVVIKDGILVKDTRDV
ncbi:MAG: metal-dependent hydrolase family protein [Acidimicrobiales bacterium]